MNGPPIYNIQEIRWGNGHPRERSQWRDGVRHGPTTQYRQTGQLWEVANYKNGLRDGLTKLYANRHVIRRINYRNGEFDGLAKWTCFGGGIRELTNWFDGFKHGHHEWKDGVHIDEWYWFNVRITKEQFDNVWLLIHQALDFAEPGLAKHIVAYLKFSDEQPRIA